MEKTTALDLFLETALRHLYKAEKAILENLATLEDKAATPQLKDLLMNHRDETKMQIIRLERIFGFLKIDVKATKMKGMADLGDQAKELLKTLADLNFSDRSKGIEGILDEGKEMLRHFADTDANDFAIASSATKVEHFEIACYEMLRFLAERYGYQDVATLLTESLVEELRMKDRVAALAESAL